MDCLRHRVSLFSALEQLESDVPALPLNHGEVDPNACKGFKKWDTLVASEVVAFGKTCIAVRAGGRFPCHGRLSQP